MKIVIWTGGALETWGPQSLDTGIGGSETAVVCLSHELARRGHHVEVVGRVTQTEVRPSRTGLGPDKQGIVRYVPFDSGASYHFDCDVFVSLRELDAFRHFVPKCRASVLWLRDADQGIDDKGHMIDYDRIFCRSLWARDVFLRNYPNVSDEKVRVKRNGIDPGKFLRQGESLDAPSPVDKTERKFRFIYSSSPDRGLARLLDLWPAIKQRVPEASLSVFYGTDNIDLCARFRPYDHSAQRASYQAHQLVDQMQGMGELGVTYFGRVGQSYLAGAFMESSLWLYPTSFGETSSITALEAMAAGAYPVITYLGALPEIVKSGAFIHYPEERLYDLAFADTVSWAVGQGRTEVVKNSYQNRQYVLKECTWEKIAAEWETSFRILIKEKSS